MQIDCKVLPKPISKERLSLAAECGRGLHTVAENAVELVLCKEGQPIDTVLLIFAQLGLDGDRDLVRLHLRTIQQLHEELALFLTPLEQLLGEAWWIG